MTGEQENAGKRGDSSAIRGRTSRLPSPFMWRLARHM
jgi:hypothetical protein